ncbi:Acetyltransferase (GNAT) family protein [Streptosporangium subroseum]|uniref:Acetyltransferase (GNAT) family protein n=1 Tax=Streptosporangium subroseum TaxID=106412 RepID=A0A239DAE7_9ACTN|nr:GNAT family N-acetyltransferase [Streptosporangium subroseum]SNS29048.1 Acetyltransferase (GNAT) family protein [Streptosporangium subroseum]
MHTIARLSPDDFRGSVKSLADLLVDVVTDGASLGFLAPFDQKEAVAWWHTRQPAVADGSLTVWVAHGPGGITGTVSLVLEGKPNGRHRAEIVKLMVHRDARGQGLARALLATAEQAAARAGTTLLLLDTVTDTAADHLYRSTGWTRYGIVPGYAADPGGTLEDCSFYYKRLTQSPPRADGAA